MNKKIFFGFAMLIIIAALIASCRPYKTEIQAEASQELKKFSSAEEIREFLLSNAVNTAGSGRYYGAAKFAITESIRPLAEERAFEASPSTADISNVAADYNIAADYSQTNIQVKGVDEADFVKNDGKYIYIISQNSLVIIDAYPGDKAEIISQINLSGTPQELFVNKNRLVVFTNDYEDVYAIPEYDYVPRPSYASRTHALVYDISDRPKPTLVKDYSINGNYFDSRMIDDHVYFIAQEGAYYIFDTPVPDVPVIMESGRKIISPEVYYFDNPEDEYNFNMVASINLFTGDVDAKTFMVGYTNNLYVSKDNIYITYQKNMPFRYYQQHNEERFYEVVVPLLPADAQHEILSIKNGGSLSASEKWSRISTVLEEMYNRMDESTKRELITKIDKAIEEYEARLEAERRKTVIHKIAIGDGEIDYLARGEVSGYLLNQFSMDESGEHFRVATTTYIYGPRESTMYNNIYVLDDDLDAVGKLEDIAPEERIYATRFIGDRLYMVTFKRIDPLFVIDLSEPSKPSILGELKIPGFSDYLHPYDENTLIGIGKETEANEWGGVSTKGLKLALFDVSDVSSPKQLAVKAIGEAGTDSEALHDHKAFLFDKKRNLLVMPVREVTGRIYDERYGYYRDNTWQGAYVLEVTPENGFVEKGTITHGTEEDYYYGSKNAVRRSLYLDNFLYTISAAKVKVNDINTADDINEIKLPYEEYRYQGPYY